ncbi:hypothetical protein MLD38_004551 [Melastoma candidum]|uniref:Uncharacterized protein n=1 Tax=Melastoma candidum TaxID=119954 RepID=A0ACB9S6G9_9MYRT|nr:hypothetical protein MLD38_004551 [Melastoma candidum]
MSDQHPPTVAHGGAATDGESAVWEGHARPTLPVALDPHERDAVFVREALLDIRGSGRDSYRVIVEIFLGRKSSHVQMIRLAYQRRFKRQLDKDILDSEPSHAFQKILVALGASHRAHQVEVSQHIAKCDARRLYGTGEGSSSGSIDEGVVLEIISKRSIPQLKLTFLNYTQIYGHSYSKWLKGKSGREFEDALCTVVKCVVNPSQYYAKLLYASIKENPMTERGRKEVVRVLMSRAGIDLDDIKAAFRRRHGMELEDAIRQNIKPKECREYLIELAEAKNQFPCRI